MLIVSFAVVVTGHRQFQEQQQRHNMHARSFLMNVSKVTLLLT